MAYLPLVSGFAMPPRYIIEQLDTEVFPWALLEFKHIVTEIDPSQVLFTNVPNSADVDKLQPLGCGICPESIQVDTAKYGRICVLDPRAPEVLMPQDADAFDCLVFGGILGNHPMDGRTERELTSHLAKAARRHLGELQMTTDTAVLVTHRILHDQVPFDGLKFVDFPDIPMGGCEVTQMPFRYLTDAKGKPRLPDGMIELWKEETALDADDIQW